MPTNLPPEYFDVEKQYRAAGSVEEKIACLEEMIATVPKHKGTDRLRADLRRKLSKLKTDAETSKKAGRHESVYHVEREGPVRVVIVGEPNVGKSSLLAALTHATPKVSEYPFTTWVPTPGMMPVHDIQLQLIDTPALSAEHIEPELFGLIRTADLILLVIDIQSRALQQLDDTVAMLNEHRIVPVSADTGSLDLAPTASIPCIILVNKSDDAEWDEEYGVLCELMVNALPTLAVSAVTGRNLEQLRLILFDRLKLIRIYSKHPNKPPDLGRPFVLRKGDTVDGFAAKVHKDFVENLKTARIWGEGVHDGQMVGRDHVLNDGDVIELHV
jgi:ribosome-interacting GTPase 1